MSNPLQPKANTTQTTTTTETSLKTKSSIAPHATKVDTSSEIFKSNDVKEITTEQITQSKDYLMNFVTQKLMTHIFLEALKSTNNKVDLDILINPDFDIYPDELDEKFCQDNSGVYQNDENGVQKVQYDPGVIKNMLLDIESLDDIVAGICDDLKDKNHKNYRDVDANALNTIKDQLMGLKFEKASDDQKSSAEFGIRAYDLKDSESKSGEVLFSGYIKKTKQQEIQSPQQDNTQNYNETENPFSEFPKEDIFSDDSKNPSDSTANENTTGLTHIENSRSKEDMKYSEDKKATSQTNSMKVLSQQSRLKLQRTYKSEIIIPAKMSSMDEITVDLRENIEEANPTSSAINSSNSNNYIEGMIYVKNLENKEVLIKNCDSFDPESASIYKNQVMNKISEDYQDQGFYITDGTDIKPAKFQNEITQNHQVFQYSKQTNRLTKVTANELPPLPTTSVPNRGRNQSNKSSEQIKQQALNESKKPSSSGLSGALSQASQTAVDKRLTDTMYFLHTNIKKADLENNLADSKEIYDKEIKEIKEIIAGGNYSLQQFSKSEDRMPSSTETKPLYKIIKKNKKIELMNLKQGQDFSFIITELNNLQDLTVETIETIETIESNQKTYNFTHKNGHYQLIALKT